MTKVIINNIVNVFKKLFNNITFKRNIIEKYNSHIVYTGGIIIFRSPNINIFLDNFTYTSKYDNIEYIISPIQKYQENDKIIIRHNNNLLLAYVYELREDSDQDDIYICKNEIKMLKLNYIINKNKDDTNISDFVDDNDEIKNIVELLHRKVDPLALNIKPINSIDFIDTKKRNGIEKELEQLISNHKKKYLHKTIFNAKCQGGILNIIEHTNTKNITLKYPKYKKKFPKLNNDVYNTISTLLHNGYSKLISHLKYNTDQIKLIEYIIQNAFKFIYDSSYINVINNKINMSLCKLNYEYLNNSTKKFFRPATIKKVRHSIFIIPMEYADCDIFTKIT